MTIDEIYKKGNLSIRSYHVCKSNEIETIFDLKKYFIKYKSFVKFRNCGRKSNEELIEICNKYKGEYLEDCEIETKKENPLKIIISELTRVQREVVNSYILINTNSLSVRSKNAILLLLNGNLKIKNFAEIIFLSEKFSINKIKNVGAKCIPELEIYISIIRNFLIEVSQSDDEKDLISLKNNFLIQRTYSIANIPSEILESESIFLLTDFLLNQNVLFDKVHTIIVNKAFKLYRNQKELTLDEIAEKVNLTRERVRQIRKICIDDLFKKLLFIQNFNDDLFRKYNIDINSNQIEINSSVVDNINITNKTNLSREFITYILFVYLCEDFALVGNIEDVLQPKHMKSRSRHNWVNFYIVDKKLVSDFDLNALINDVSVRLSNRIEESYIFNFKSYLFRFLTNGNVDILNELFPIAETIINDEFDVYLDLNENIEFKRNTIKQLPEYIIDAIEYFGVPVKLLEIYNWIEEKYPNLTKSEEALRGSCQRSDQVIYFGRSSTYGLKKWENSRKDIKGGTIRQLAEEYLSKFDAPKTYNDLTDYILKYRSKSNMKSIVHNLKLEESGIFIFYEGAKVGLSYKKYDHSFILLSEVKRGEKKTWEERFECLQNFIIEEKRLPLSNAVSEDEIILYRWFNIQKSKINKGELNVRKTSHINQIAETYPSTRGKRRNVGQKYKELVLFLEKNKRLPSNGVKEEQYIYQFFNKQKKLFYENKLKGEENQFIEVVKIIENIKYENKRN